MRTRTPVVLLLAGAGALGVVAYRRALARMASSAFAGSVALAGYGPFPEREPVVQQDLLKLRREEAERNTTGRRRVLVRLLERAKAEYDRYTTGVQKEAPVLDFLIVSGGGDWGAFGAGFLKGWHTVPAQHPLAKPEFDIVTGVSTGTLIAPFAFLGDEPATDEIVALYRNPGADWVKQRGMLYFLPDNISFAEVPGLEREMRQHVTMDMVLRIAKGGADGRMLVVNTTNLDDAAPRVFDLVEEAQRAAESGELERIHNIMLASAGIPGAFPFRIIDQELYVDGGVTGNILYGGRAEDDDALPTVWQRTYPDVPMPKIRYWIIFNNQFRPVPHVTPPKWLAVVQRSLETATRASTATAVKHLVAQARIAQLKYNADVEIRLVSIPGDWFPPVPGVFVKETMNNLADLGERMGADPASWGDLLTRHFED
jgi:predicted patatin/cPLA2 family phospholipase